MFPGAFVVETCNFLGNKLIHNHNNNDDDYDGNGYHRRRRRLHDEHDHDDNDDNSSDSFVDDKVYFERQNKAYTVHETVGCVGEEIILLRDNTTGNGGGPTFYASEKDRIWNMIES